MRRDPGQPDAATGCKMPLGGCCVAAPDIASIIDAVVGAHAAATRTVASNRAWPARTAGRTGWPRSMDQRRSADDVAPGRWLVARVIGTPSLGQHTFDELEACALVIPASIAS